MTLFRAAQRILDDLDDRAGFETSSLDDDVRGDMLESFTRIIEEHLTLMAPIRELYGHMVGAGWRPPGPQPTVTFHGMSTSNPRARMTDPQTGNYSEYPFPKLDDTKPVTTGSTPASSTAIPGAWL